MVFDIVIGRTQDDLKKYGKTGTVLLGKHYIKMGQTTAMSNPIYLDVIRSHIVFICGKRGSGKCLAGDTKITLADGREIALEKLDDEQEHIFALNDQLKIQSCAREGFYQREVDEIIAITLRSGKALRLTPEHPLFTVKGWAPAQELSINDRIATPRVVPAFGDNDMNEARVKLLAYLLAEGHLSNRFVLFSNTDEKIRNDFGHAVHEFDAQLRIKDHKKDSCYRIVSTAKPKLLDPGVTDSKGRWIKPPKLGEKNSLIQWLRALGLYDKLSPEKFIPTCIFTLPKNKLSLFLNRLFSCDGSIYHIHGYWAICYASTSRILIDQVQSLLLRFGIISKIRKKMSRCNGKVFPSFELVIGGEFVERYLQEIGFYGYKEKKQARALKHALQIQRNPNVDTIPQEIWQLTRPKNWAEIGRAMGYAHPKAMRESMHDSPSRQKLLQIALADQNELLEAYATSDIYWDEIISIERINQKTKVYDISIPQFHNFIANNIIVHNSYTMGAIAEGIIDLPVEIKNNLSVIMLDTMGVYWTMKYPNHRDEDLLKEWGLEGKGLDIKIYTPAGYYQDYKEKGIPTDKAFSLRPGDLTPEDWFLTFDIPATSPLGVFIERLILDLRDQRETFSIMEIVDAIRASERIEESIKQAAENRFLAAESWGVFSKEGTPMQELAAPGQVTVLDVSAYATMPGGWKIKSLVIGLIAQRLFIERMIAKKEEEYAEIHATMHYLSEEEKKEKKVPMIWLVVDEAHEFLPAEGKTTASGALTTILREGRQPGISLILATQQPGKVNTDVMTQSDVVLSHRITAKIDTDALKNLMQSYMREGLDVELDNLPRVKGAAIILDDNNERMYPMRVHPFIDFRRSAEQNHDCSYQPQPS
ncbi:hypothetical protein J4457_00210 [Candidatus Woesearchaeota archaeon]|nr:hypothetical protein [Candidatus Woesearchaeota archaeon]